jgi:DNA repair exonuclease SbcCD ATPase subunit
MADILNSALTGDADFAGTIFNTPTPEASPEASPEATPEAPKEEAPKEEKAAPVKEEPKTEKKPKATKEEVEKKVADITKEVSSKDTNEQKSEDPSEDLPLNPHFSDKPVADKPEGDDSEKGIQSWKEIKSELKKIREQRDEAVAKLKITEEEKAKVSQGEVESFKKEIEEYKSQLAVLNQELKAANFERSPEYIEKIKKPLTGLQADVQAIAESNGTDYGKLWQALTEPDVSKRNNALEDLTADFKRMEQMSIIKIADKYHELADFHNRFQKDAETLIEAERARKAQEEQQFIENDLRLQKTFATKAWTGLEDRYEFLREIDGQNDWNNHIRSARQAAAETNLDRLTVEDRSSILAKAAVVPFLESAVNHYKNQLKATLEAKDSKISELEEQVKSLVGATPSLGSSSEKSDNDGDEDDKSLTNFGASILGRR